MSKLDSTLIEKNWRNLIRELELAPSKPALVAVTKTRSCAEIEFLYSLGQRHFGENRVEELLQKAQALKTNCPDIIWHFIGTFQSNKLAKLATLESPLIIHSLASLSHVKKLLAQIPISLRGFFLQINTAGEDEKSGFAPSLNDLEAVVQFIANQLALMNKEKVFLGLMTMGRLRTDNKSQAALSCFSDLHNLRKVLSDKHKQFQWDTSMGMSSDYQLAISMGSKWVRVGSLLFS